MKNVKIPNAASYATYANAERAVNRKLGEIKHYAEDESLRYIIQATEDGRFRPIFIGNYAMQMGIHFHFACIN